jgi:5'-methylthioadenosine phosphorylase
MYAVIGGSGLASLPDLEIIERRKVTTPYGEPSSTLVFGQLAGAKVVFLARHGEAHSIAPHQINYRANVRALADAGATAIVAVASVGGIRAGFGPEALVVPDQIIDYTWGRASTFFEHPEPVRHVDMTRPYSDRLRARILAAAERSGERMHDGGTYGATQGPRLETAAEVERMARDGADLAGMTGMPEAALARELGLDYAAIAVVVNHAAGRGGSAKEIRMQDLEAALGRAIARVRTVLRALVAEEQS